MLSFGMLSRDLTLPFTSYADDLQLHLSLDPNNVAILSILLACVNVLNTDKSVILVIDPQWNTAHVASGLGSLSNNV